MAIRFFNEDIEFPNINRSQTKKWIKDVVASYAQKRGEINYIFTSDKAILKINQDYLQHDYYTDVITFDYSGDNKIAGDIFISLETVASNTQKFNQNFDTELRRVIIHGVLHLIGFKDKTPEEEKQMRKEEEKALILFKKT
jgi:rRNA maturation RNase YbeY